MKANKITLKKMRIEYLERIAGALEYEIKSNRDNLENAKENLEEAKTDKDDFQYSVSVPDYLLWNGNLAITEQDIQYALIIWMKPFRSGFSQGVLFNGYNNLNVQIMLKNSSTAESEEDQPIVDENDTVISMLFNKANQVWMLGLE